MYVIQALQLGRARTLIARARPQAFFLSLLCFAFHVFNLYAQSGASLLVALPS